MKIMLNPTKICYIQDNKSLRIGNFPETGKVLDCGDEKIFNFFKQIVNVTDYKIAVDLLVKCCKVNIEDAEQTVNYLLKEKILVSEDEYNSLTINDRYNRQNLYFFMLSNKDLTKKFNTVKHKNILILGVGGVGSVVAEYLTRAGFENLTLLDCDVVEKSNLVRQIAYFDADVGLNKLICIENHLKSINPNIKISTCYKKVLQENDVDNLILKSDFVVNTLDKPIRKIRRLINEVCVKNKKPVLFAGFAEHVGMVGPFVVPNRTACLNCIDNSITADEGLDNIKLAPSYGPLCGVIGAMVSDEVINYFLRFKKKNLVGKTLMINLYNYKTTIMKWKRQENCKVCGGGK